MASQRTGCGKTKEVPMKSEGQLDDPLRWIALMDTNQQLAVSFSQHSPSLSTTQRCSNIVPGNCPENSLIVREALLMNLPHHLVLQTVQHRVQTSRANYTDIKELVADMFAAKNWSCSGQDQEVPMETNQLEEVLMMNSLVVKKALRMGAPPHLIKPVVRAKILSNSVGYTDVSELLKDLNY